MNVIHLLSGGGIGGIETLCEAFSLHSTHNNTFVFLWKGGIVADEMMQQGVDVIKLQVKSKNYLKQYKVIRDICDNKKADIIIAHHADPFSHYCLIRIKKDIPSIRTIVYAHGNAVDMYATRRRWAMFLKKRLFVRSLGSADKIVAISQSVKESLYYYLHADERKIVVIYNGIDTSQFVPAPKNANQLRHFIYVGRLIEKKGVQITLWALSRLKGVDYQFTVVGDGPYRGELERQVAGLGIEGRVKFLGSRRDVSELLRQSDIFIHMPVWEEGFGITIIEAMASGLICVCAKSGAIPEIIEDGKSGFLVEKDNADELAAKIREVITMNDDEVQLISRQAVERAKYFSIETFAMHLDRLLDEICSS